ncbi:MAG: rod shape-determining protein RodA, partial [bacterium]|nr:rod shape-determining protein RodA [bacterium]
MFDRRLLQYFDWGLLGLAVVIGGCGLLTLFSAVTAETPHPQKIIFYKQLIWFSGALVAMVVSFSINYKLIDRWGLIIYIGCILLL